MLSVSSLIVSSVDLPRRFPICPSGRRPWVSAALVILRYITASTTFPIVLSREIGRHTFSDFYYSTILPGFLRTIMLALRNIFGKYSSLKLTFVSFMMAL